MSRIMFIVALAMLVQVTLGQTKSQRNQLAQRGGYDGSEEFLAIPSQHQSVLTSHHNDSPAATFTVTTTIDTGAGSLRKAITDANASPGLDLITFGIGSGSVVIYPKTPLPQITSPVIVDGTTQPAYAGVPLIEIDGNDVLVVADGLTLLPAAAGSTIRGLVVSFFPGQGIVVNANACVVEGCYVGTTLDGANGRGNAFSGIFVQDASNCRIGGTTPLQKNVLSANGQFGIIIRGLSASDTVQGNYIGTDANGSYALGNSFDGLRLSIYTVNGGGASNCLVGGTTSGARNIISGNDSLGVGLFGQTVTNNRIIGNYIGANATGTSAIPNGLHGVSLRNSAGNTIGTASSNSIGGPTPGERNVISGNARNGVSIVGGPSGGTGNRILGNHIGTYPSGTTALGNGWHGIQITTLINNGTITQTRIGGASLDSGNVICANGLSGVSLDGLGVTGNSVLGNRIGLSASLPLADTLGNHGDGVRINGAPNNKIGGPQGSASNTIVGNWDHGIEIIGTTATNNKVEQNYIGTDASETRKLGNKQHGVLITSSRDTIGGLSSTRRNVIAFNGASGVAVQSGTGNLIRYNSIVGNGLMGIDLDTQGITPNDSLDVDTGANDKQNFPILDSAVVVGLTTKIYGRLDGKPNTRYTLDFFSNDSADASHFGEGKTFLRDTLDVRCDATGRRQFMVTVPVPLDTSRHLTATATDSLGNTSEFSRALCFADADSDGIFDDWEASGNGIDVNCDGIIDLDLYTLGARPNHKDILVEVDAMTGYGPLPGVLNSVIAAFDRVPDALLHNPDGQDGIKLHIDTLQDATIPVRNFPNAFTDFDSVKRQYFGSPTQRADTNSRYILEAKRLVYHYCLFARTYGTAAGDTASSGLARGTLSNDFMVTLGSTGPRGWNGGSDSIQMGTFMHELGHTLGLRHGGGDDIGHKPNYYSVMNYTWQVPYRPPSWQAPGSWSLDFSRSHLPDLNESALDERTGLGPPWNTYRVVSVPYSDSLGNIKHARLRPAWPADWNGFYSIESRPVAVDINRIHPSFPASPGELLRGYSDWQNLGFNFRSDVDVNASRFSLPSEIGQELTRAMYEELRALPPPRPSGSFIMDGQLDASATLLTSNSGITLYTAMSGPQLYVASNSAQSQGADMFIFVAVNPGALQSAPWLKSGQVAAWSAVLGNRSSDNFLEWSNGAGQSLYAISVDTAGSVLEGVIDLEYLTGDSPPTVFLAVGTYQSGNGGVLLAQAPVGNGDGNINANEFIAFETALPIQLASFTATPLSNGHVRLDWITLSEVNNYGFKVQRKRTGDPDFQRLPNSFVPGHGTTTEPHSYSFIDSSASSGQWSYRLEQMDLDGIIHYGPEVIVEMVTGVEEGSFPTVFALYQNFPNPFNPTTAIRFDVPRLSHVTLTVYNVLGQVVMTLVNEIRKPGTYEAPFNASALSSGVYFYNLKTDGYVSTKKMILTK